MYILALCDKRSYVETGRHFFIVCNTGKNWLVVSYCISFLWQMSGFFMLNTQVCKILRSRFSKLTKSQSHSPRTKISTSVITLMIWVPPTLTSMQLHKENLEDKMVLLFLGHRTIPLGRARCICRRCVNSNDLFSLWD